MIAGVPGVGISGIFYLACAFLMPFFEVVQTIRGRSSKKRWKLVFVQFSLFWGIMGASFSVGLLLVYIIRKSIETLNITSQMGQVNAFRIQPLMLSLLVMVVIFTGMHLWNRFRDRESQKVS